MTDTEIRSKIGGTDMTIRWWTCFFGHKWEAWRPITRQMVNIARGGKEYPYTDDGQLRECRVCAKRQIVWFE